MPTHCRKHSTADKINQKRSSGGCLLEPATGKVLKTDVRSNRQPKMFFRRMAARTGDRKRSEDGCLLEPATENVRIPDRPCPNIEDNHEARIHELLRILYNQPIYFRPSFESKSSTTQRLSPKLLQTTSSRPWSIVLPFYFSDGSSGNLVLAYNFSIYRYCLDIDGYRKIDSDIVSKRIGLSFTTLQATRIRENEQRAFPLQAIPDRKNVVKYVRQAVAGRHDVLRPEGWRSWRRYHTERLQRQNITASKNSRPPRYKFKDHQKQAWRRLVATMGEPESAHGSGAEGDNPRDGSDDGTDVRTLVRTSYIALTTDDDDDNDGSGDGSVDERDDSPKHDEDDNKDDEDDELTESEEDEDSDFDPDHEGSDMLMGSDTSARLIRAGPRHANGGVADHRHDVTRKGLVAGDHGPKAPSLHGLLHIPSRPEGYADRVRLRADVRDGGVRCPLRREVESHRHVLAVALGPHQDRAVPGRAEGDGDGRRKPQSPRPARGRMPGCGERADGPLHGPGHERPHAADGAPREPLHAAQQAADVGGASPVGRRPGALREVGNVGFDMNELQGMIRGLIQQARRTLTEELLLLPAGGGTDGTDAAADPMERAEEACGRPVERKRRMELPQGWKGVVAGGRAPLATPAKQAESTPIVAGNAQQPINEAVVKFREKLMVLVHITGGQPARGPELLSVRHTNTAGGRHRNVFVERGYVAMATRYHKGNSATLSTRIIHRYLPREVGELLVWYLWLVLPFTNSPTSRGRYRWMIRALNVAEFPLWYRVAMAM
ncbi:hypothetical protein V8E54_012889 [Elaphomyces granulatus]